MQIVHFDAEVRAMLPESDDEIVLIRKFEFALDAFDEKPTKKHRRTLQQLWLKIEKASGGILHRSSGVPRDEVFS